VTRPYILSKGSAADLLDITRYTVSNWGEAQCRTYIADLEMTAEAVARGKGVFKDMGSLLPGLRMAACGKHYIFCMPQAGAASVILAVLHERMDLMVRLKSRLEG
jgi:plasmid stabilization system protein ParE